MLILLTVLIALICILLIGVVLIQNPKGGGLDASFAGAGANQVLGAANSTNFMERLTWYLVGALLVLCLVTTLFTGKGGAKENDTDLRTAPTGFYIESPASSTDYTLS